MTPSQIEKRISELEKRTGGAVEDPVVIVFVEQWPDGETWPKKPYNRDEFTVWTSPQGHEVWYPKYEQSPYSEPTPQKAD